MQRIFIAALAALSLAFIAPAAASAQYEVPYFYPTSNPTPYPPVAGLEDHPFGFGINWAPDAALEADFVDYIAWNSARERLPAARRLLRRQHLLHPVRPDRHRVLRPDPRRRPLAGPDRPLRPAGGRPSRPLLRLRRVRQRPQQYVFCWFSYGAARLLPPPYGARANINMRTCSAEAAVVVSPGTWTTATPATAAECVSTLSRPAPQRATTTRSGSAAINSRSTCPRPRVTTSRTPRP